VVLTEVIRYLTRLLYVYTILVPFFGSFRIEGRTNGRSMKESVYSAYCVQFLTEQHVHFLRHVTYSDCYIRTSSQTASTYLPVYIYDTRTIHVRFTYDTRTIPVRFTYDTRTIHVRYTYDTGSDQIIRFGLTQVRCQEWRPRDLKKGKRQKENNTWDSNVVPHRSTNQARTCLTSLSGREAVLSCWYGRSHNIAVSKPLETI
jgi:hypothetical protein